MRWRVQTAEDTEALGGQLALASPPGNALTVVHLVGNLGAGKTTFARGFLRACGVTGLVRSPTYTLLELYETSLGVVVHLDLYRLRDPAELETLGLREWARAGHAWLVEWPERGGEGLPPADLRVSLTAGGAGHEARIEPLAALGESWLRRLASAWAPSG